MVCTSFETRKTTCMFAFQNYFSFGYSLPSHSYGATVVISALWGGTFFAKWDTKSVLNDFKPVSTDGHDIDQ